MLQPNHAKAVWSSRTDNPWLDAALVKNNYNFMLSASWHLQGDAGEDLIRHICLLLLSCQHMYTPLQTATHTIYMMISEGGA
jgi:hypothetical protein